MLPETPSQCYDAQNIGTPTHVECFDSKRCSYDAVELTEWRLDSDDNEVISASRPDDRRRLTISYCCLVCWCMSLEYCQQLQDR